jgi:hypothetical protein
MNDTDRVLKRSEAGLEVRPALSPCDDPIPRAIRDVSYWDEYAPWYKLWLEHTDYHHGIKDILAGLARPGWRVLDIGGGSGVLAVPLLRSGCRVTVVEPSGVMRKFLREEMAKERVDAAEIIPLPWEALPPAEVADRDLALACNSLHLTGIGTVRSMRRILEARPAHVLVASELEIPFASDGDGGAGYDIAAAGSFRTENSFRYHSVEEALRHLDLKDRHGQEHPSREDFVRSLVFKAGHYVNERWTTVRWLHLRRSGD